MRDHAAPSQDRAPAFTLREAADVLGVSLNTLRRRIKAGQVRADRVWRPQGHVWQVYLDGAAPCRDGSGGTVQRDRAGTVQQPPADLMRAEAMAAYSTALLAPLVAELATTRVKLVEQAEQIGRQGERIATLEAQLERQASQQPQEGGSASNLGAPSAEPARGPSTSWWRRWWPALVGAGVAAATAASSCGASGTVRHAALCGQARDVMDAGGRDGVPFATWNQVHAVVDVAARVC